MAGEVPIGQLALNRCGAACAAAWRACRGKHSHRQPPAGNSLSPERSSLCSHTRFCPRSASSAGDRRQQRTHRQHAVRGSPSRFSAQQGMPRCCNCNMPTAQLALQQHPAAMQSGCSTAAAGHIRTSWVGQRLVAWLAHNILPQVGPLQHSAHATVGQLRRGRAGQGEAGQGEGGGGVAAWAWDTGMAAAMWVAAGKALEPVRLPAGREQGRPAACPAAVRPAPLLAPTPSPQQSPGPWLPPHPLHLYQRGGPTRTAPSRPPCRQAQRARQASGGAGIAMRLLPLQEGCVRQALAPAGTAGTAQRSTAQQAQLGAPIGGECTVFRLWIHEHAHRPPHVHHLVAGTQQPPERLRLAAGQEAGGAEGG